MSIFFLHEALNSGGFQNTSELRLKKGLGMNGWHYYLMLVNFNELAAQYDAYIHGIFLQ